MSDLVKLADVVPAGTSVIAAWPFSTILPDQDVLEAAAAELGEPFRVTYLEAHHQGVTLAQDMTGLEIGNHFMKATANDAPALLAVDPEWSGVIENEKSAAEVISDVKETLDSVRSAAEFSAGLPRYLLIGGLVLGGVLLVGFGAYYLATRGKR